MLTFNSTNIYLKEITQNIEENFGYKNVLSS